jgi:hypothetical protein
MELKKLIAQSLSTALQSMRVGETCLSPDNYAHSTVKKTCHELNAKGYIFSTRTREGMQTITRLK